MKVGDYGTAKEQLLVSGPHDAQGWALLTECNYWLEDYPALADASRTSLQYSPAYRPRITYLLQRAYIELLNKAIIAFENNNNQDAYQLFDNAMNLGEIIDADISPRLFELEDEVLILAGSNFIRLDDYAQAKKCFERVREIRGNDPEALERLALCDFYLKDYISCLVVCERLLEMQPGNLNALTWRAQTIDTLRTPEEALNAYRDALEYHPDDIFLHRNLGIILYRLEKWALASQHLEKAYKANPDNPPDLLILIAECFYNDGKYREALERFESANRIRSGDPDILRYIGACYWKLNLHEKADSVLMQANQLKERYPDQ